MSDLDLLEKELDELRAEILEQLGDDDADYIRRVIRVQRWAEVGGRVSLMAGVLPPAWFAGVALLSLSKILENMEIGHNVMHGQWDWMRDPEIHSTTWEWDNVCASTQWKHSHNYLHHQWTNVVGRDHDIGYGILRVHPEQRWKRHHLAQPLIFVTLATLFQWGVGAHDIENDLARSGDEDDGTRGPVTLASMMPKLREFGRKARRQVVKDYAAFPLLALPLGLPSALAVLTGNATANLVRNLWSFTVIFCGHFPEGVELFEYDPDESRGAWYQRQILGSANFEGGPLMHLMAGNLSHQIEHHLFPDLPSNRYGEIAPQVQAICERHGLAYNTGSLAKQFGSVVKRVVRLSLP